MEPFVRRFIRASLVWFGVGSLLGLSMSFWPMESLAYRPAHAHAVPVGRQGAGAEPARGAGRLAMQEGAPA